MSNQDFKEYEFNLVKAQKFLDKLKANVPSTSTANQSIGRGRRIVSQSSTKVVVNFNNLVETSTNEQKVFELFNKNTQNSNNELQSKLNVLRDLKNLKEHIYTTNAKIGLSQVLTQIDLLTEERKLYEDIKNRCQSVNYTKDNLQDILNNYNKSKETPTNEFNDTLLSVQFKLYSDSDLEDTIVKYTQELTKLEDKRDTLNATTKVKFTFSRDSCKILGI